MAPDPNKPVELAISRQMPCVYRPGQTERRLFFQFTSSASDTIAPDQYALYARLIAGGFRRAGMVTYRPACPSCTACVPVRIPVDRFKPSRGQQRILARPEIKNLVRQQAPNVRDDHYQLFCAYLQARHPESEMNAINRMEFTYMAQQSPAETHMYEWRDPDGVLRAACITDYISGHISGDQLSGEDFGLSAVYSFFDPALARLSLGSFMIMDLVRAAAEQNLPYVYLGYWVSMSPKMAYKANFRPLQCLKATGWCDHQPAKANKAI